MQLVVFVTCETYPDFQPDDQLVADTLREKGVRVEPAPWNGPQDQIEQADLILVRSTWDYPTTPGSFRQWLRRYEEDPRCLNPSALMQWNMDKSYLLALQANGAPIINTVKLAANTEGVVAMMREMDLHHGILKPLVGATASGISRICREDVAGIENAIKMLGDGSCLLQPFLEAIEIHGETSLMFFNGQFSHAVVKRAKSGDFRVQKEHGGSTSLLDSPKARTLATAEHILSLLPVRPVYARIDLVVTPQKDFLMEVELIEPDLFFSHSKQAVSTFTSALMEYL